MINGHGQGIETRIPLKITINTLTLFTQSTNANSGLLTAHNEVWMVLRHFIRKNDSQGERTTATPIIT